MLVGMRFSGAAAGSGTMAWVKTDLGTDATNGGIFTSSVPKRPTQFDARMLPRCGVEMKITRFMSVR